MDWLRRLVARRDGWATALLLALALGAALHQFVTSRDGILTQWKGGGFGMYTTPHGIQSRAIFLVVNGLPLRLAPSNPVFADWLDTVNPSSARYLKRMQDQAEAMVTYPRDAAADRLMASASRVIWDKVLFGSSTEVGKQPVSAMAVTVVEIARRPSVGVIESRVVYSHAGE